MNANRIWIISLVVALGVSAIYAVTKAMGIVLPDMILRSMGALELAAIPLLIITTVERTKKR